MTDQSDSEKTAAVTLFGPVSTQPDWPALEHEVLDWWEETDAFGKLERQNAGAEPWSFQDGPITANNPMAVHHAWGRTYKDAWGRFRAMQGHDLRWQNGYDCQGLWVEVNVERELGFRSKRDIEAHGIAAFVRRCKERVLRMAALQTMQSIRLGMWMRWDDPDRLRWLADNIDRQEPITIDTPMGEVTDTVERLIGQLGHAPWYGSYFTFSDENNYMIWHFLKTCHERGWIYQGTDVMPWCTRCGTGLSQHEIVTEGYQETTHLSPTLRFPLVDRPGESLLVWTTTPWTLTSNVAAAVGPELTYVRVRQGDEVLYVAEGAAKTALRGEFEVLDRLTGADMLGWRYEGPFDELPAQVEGRLHHAVIAWEEVGEEEGTGIVHIAPGCGAEDFELGKELGLPAIAPLDEDGKFVDGFDWMVGRHALELADEVLNNLHEKGRLYHAEQYTHRYPVCWRCQSELVFRLVDEWFISMGELYDKPREEVTDEEKAASLRYQIMDVVDQIRWIPSYGLGREQDWLRNMGDWMISKKRYWGLALPIWTCDECGWFDVLGNREELEERAVAGWDEFDGHSPHRPYIDAIEVRCDKCGAQAKRLPDVGDPWLDAGIVPFSTARYREEPDYWQRWFPADFICESFPGQFRNWFYSLLAMSTVLKNEPPFMTVLGYATLFAEDGREMHKSWGNAIEFNEAAERMGVDVMRWMYLAHRPQQNLHFGYGPGGEVRRRFLIPLWNVYSFFVQYANVSDGWQPPALPLPRGTDDGDGADWSVAGSGDGTAGSGTAGSGTAEGGAAESGRTAGGGAAGGGTVGGGAVGGGAAEGGRSADGDSTWAELDRWILVRLAEVTGVVTEQLDDYSARRATIALESFVEDLSNWYVRRSRRRFWDGDGDALDTLYTVLVSLTRVLAPLIPFTTEHMYQNLIRGHDAEAPESVHHTRWPLAPEIVADDAQLLRDMAVVMRLAALGRSARSSSNVKLRQPLAGVTVAVRNDDEAAAVERLGAHLTSELNVKGLEVVRDEGALVVYSVRPVLPVLGPKYGQKVPAIRKALEAADASAVAAAVTAGEAVSLDVDGEALELLPEEVEVMASAREGLATAEEDGYVVGISTDLTDELIAEGLARDVVRAVQQLRKDSGLEITDRIELAIDGPEPVSTAVKAWHDYVAGETLAESLGLAPPPSDMVTVDAEIGGESVTLGLRKA